MTPKIRVILLVFSYLAMDICGTVVPHRHIETKVPPPGEIHYN